MKVIISYAVDFEVDIPKKNIDEILSFPVGMNLERGDAFNGLAHHFHPMISTILRNCDGAEITGVYNPSTLVNGQVIFENENYPEVIWEG